MHFLLGAGASEEGPVGPRRREFIILPGDFVDWADVSQIGPLLWQVRVTHVSSLSASPTTAVAQSMKHWPNLRNSTVHFTQTVPSYYMLPDQNRAVFIRTGSSLPLWFFDLDGFSYFLSLWFLFGWIFLEVPGTAFIWMSFLKSVPVRFSFMLRFEGLEYDIGRIYLINL